MTPVTANAPQKSSRQDFAKSSQFLIFSPPLMDVAESLLNIKAVKFNVNEPFVWTSGIKSPIYCDIRIVNSFVEARDLIVGTALDYITPMLQDIDIIAGVSTGGIPLGVLLATRTNLPFIYVRGKAKEYGLKKQIEGAEFESGKKVLLIEDHISTGGSSINAVEALREEGFNVVCLLSIMTYGFEPTNNKFKENNINHHSLCHLEAILTAAEIKGIISPDVRAEVLKFRESPTTWWENRNRKA